MSEYREEYIKRFEKGTKLPPARGYPGKFDKEKEKAIFKMLVETRMVLTKAHFKKAVNGFRDQDGKIPPGLICVICLKMVYDPLICAKCGNAIYCTLCVKIANSEDGKKCVCGQILDLKPV